MKKCPLCGGEIVSGVCFSCGHHPDERPEENTAAPVFRNPYAAEPNEPVTKAQEAVPQAEENLPQIEDIPEIPSIDPPDAASLPTAKQVRDAARQRRAAERLKKQEEKNAETAGIASKPFVPYVKPEYGSPELRQADSDMPAKTVKTVSDFAFYHWWKFLAVAIVPSLGYLFALFYITINRDKERRVSEIFLAAALLAEALILQYFNWAPFGIDTFIRLLVGEILRQQRHHRY